MKTSQIQTASRIAALGLTSLITVFAFPSEAVDAEALYVKHCQKCHGADGRGDTKAGKMTKTPDIITTEWKQGNTVAALTKTLGAKLGKMPSFAEKLSEQERAIVSQFTIDLVAGSQGEQR